MSEAIDIICPVKDQDWERFDILISSLDKHLKIPYTLIAISPSGKCPVRRNNVLSYADSEIIPCLSEKKYNHSGWWKQQAIKLEASKKCKNEPVLILDADCFMVKDMFYEDIVVNNRIRIKIDHGGSWDNWYFGSSKILNLDFDYKHNRIGVTPLILSKTIMNCLVGYLKALFNDKHWQYLLSNTKITSSKFNPPDSPTWTEYCLYHIYGMKSRIWDQYHINENINLSGNCFWDAKQAETWDPSLSFNDPDFYFTVAQSISGKSAKWVKEKIADYL